MNRSESLAKIAPALVEAQKKMGAAMKDSKNPFFKSKYADLNAVIDAAVGSLNEQGIAVLQTPAMVMSTDGSTKQVIETVLLHTSGEYITSQTEAVAAKANDPQAAGSALSYARRYSLLATVTMKAEDDDGEAAMGRTTKVETKAVPVAKVEAAPVAAETTPLTGAGGKKVSFSRKSAAPAAVQTTGDEL